MTTPLTGRPTFAAIDAAALRDNFAAVRATVPAHVVVLVVVKASAYGHGVDLGSDVMLPMNRAAAVHCIARRRVPLLTKEGPGEVGQVAAIRPPPSPSLVRRGVHGPTDRCTSADPTLRGSQNGAEISVSEVAAWQGTIAYEVLAGVGRRVPRIWQ